VWRLTTPYNGTRMLPKRTDNLCPLFFFLILTAMKLLKFLYAAPATIVITVFMSMYMAIKALTRPDGVDYINEFIRSFNELALENWQEVEKYITGASTIFWLFVLYKVIV
jgi:hypothetical protein